jgi:hypothetical protein
MALTQEQVDAWFDANPNATAEEVAAAVQSVGGLAANEGLASMIANRYAIAEPEVTNYYNTWAGVPVEDKTAKIDTKVDLPAFTDTIFTGTPTTQEELLSVLADSTVTGGTGNDTIVGATGVDTVVGGTGNDTVVSGTGADTVVGSTTQTQAVANPFAAITDAWTNGDYAATNAIIASSNLTADDIQSYYNLDDYTMDWVLRQGIKTADQVSTVTGATGNDTVVGATENDTVTGVTAADTVVGATGNDTVVGATGNDATYTAGNWPTIISGTTGTDGDVLTTTTTSDGTPFYLRDEDGGGLYQNPATVESYAPFIHTDGQTYYAIYAPVFSSGKAWNETPITGYMTEAQFRAFQGGSTMGDAFQNILNSPVGSFGLGLLGPYGQLINAANAASKDDWFSALVSGIGAAQGFGVTDLGGFDIKTVKNTAAVLNAADKKNLAGAFTAGSDLIGGVPGDYKTLSSLASATLALKNNDTSGFLNSLGDLTGSSDAKVAAAALKLKSIFESGNTSQLNSALNNFSAAVNGTSTSGTTGSTAVADFENTEITRLKGLGYTNQQIQDYFRSLDNLTDVLDTAASTVVGASGNDVTLPTGVQLASTGDGVFRTDVGGVPTYAESANASSVTAPLGYKLLSTSEVENKPAGSYYDITANAWFKPDTAVTDLTGDATIQADAALFNNSLGTLDQLDANRTSDDFAEFLKTIGITNATQLTDSGLSNQDILDMINAGVDTVTVTGAKGNDTISGATANDGLETVTVTGAKGNDTLTGGTGNDTGTLSCPAGKVPNADGTACIDEVIVKGTRDPCPAGTVYDEALDKCVPLEQDPCPTGYHRDASGQCVQDECPEGYLRDLTTGECVLIKDEEPCAEGYERDELTGQCIPVVTIKGKKCDPGFVYDEDLKFCVPITEEPCPTGFHRNESGSCVLDECPEGYVRDLTTGECVLPEEPCADGYHRDETTGLCVPDDDAKCETGYEKVNGTCVPVCQEGYVRNLATGVCEKPLDCPEGYEPNEAGTECIPKITIEECKDGKVRDPISGLCVLPPVECDPGYHLENGICVPNEEPCATGFYRDETTGLCIPNEEEPCPEGYARDEITGKCIPVVVIQDKKCDPGFVYNEDLKQCVPIEEEPCADGFHLDEATGLCVPDDDDKCETGYEKVNGTCVPVCKEGYIRNLATGVCETEEKGCPPGQVKDATGKCVPIVKPPPPPPIVCPTGFKLVNGACVPIPKTTAMPTMGASGTGEKTDPIYAGGMDSFNLLATLQELLAEEAPKKDDKKSKDKTKMASGGHLDDLLAEQMTVDDLLKLLR